MSSNKVWAEALGGQHSWSSRLTFLHSKQGQAPVHTAPLGFLLYNRIYFNDLCIYVIGVYWNPGNALLLFLGYPWSYRGENPLELLCLVNYDRGRSQVASSAREISALCTLLEERLAIKLIRALICDWARKLWVSKWSITGWKGWEWIRRYLGLCDGSLVGGL
jgi:hypothetical protein